VVVHVYGDQAFQRLRFGSGGAATTAVVAPNADRQKSAPSNTQVRTAS
jgi:hypothetical protein